MDLAQSGISLGGIPLARKIGSGSFGDVYISPDFKVCVKIIFRSKLSPESYKKEVEAIQCISSCVREHCGILKFLGGGKRQIFNYAEPFTPWAPDRTADFEMYQEFPVIPEFWKKKRKISEDKIKQEFFFYLMLAADNLSQAPDYCPDTLENRSLRGILKQMTDNEKIQVIAEIMDALLFLYRLRITDCPANRDKGEMIRIAHGDIKPANILFVNGHARLGDLGATLQINPEERPSIGTPRFMMTPFEQEKLEEKCQGDYFAYAVLSDIFALGQTAQYMLQCSEPEERVPQISKLSMLADLLNSFAVSSEITPGNAVEKLENLRSGIACGKRFHRPSYYGTEAPYICLNNLYEFSRIWQVTEAESVKRFRVKNADTQWGRYADILTAERMPAFLHRKIKLHAREKNAEGPLLVYLLKRSQEIIVLSHDKGAFTPSLQALERLQNKIVGSAQDDARPNKGKASS